MGLINPPQEADRSQACRGLGLRFRPALAIPAPSLLQEPPRTLPRGPSAQELDSALQGTLDHEPLICKSPQLSQPRVWATYKEPFRSGCTL